MQWQTNPYFLPMFLAGLTGLLNVFIVSRRLKVVGALPLLLLGLSVSEWALTYAMELASRELPAQILWAKAQYLGIASVPTLFFLFAATYAQAQRILRSKRLWMIWIVPITCLLLVWTNEYHSLIWTRISQQDFGTHVMAFFGHGFAFYLFVVYSYGMLLAGTALLVRQAVKVHAEFKMQTFLMIFGVMVNWAGNILYLSGANPIPGLDWTPLGLIFSGIIYSVALFQFRLLGLVPVAGETVLESMDDIVIVLDNSARVIYLNRAFEFYFQTDLNKFVGRSASIAFEQWHDLVRLCNQQNTVRSETVINLPGRDPLYFDTRVSNIRGKRRGDSMGRVLVLDDITEQKKAESRATLFYDSQVHSGKSDHIPMVLMYRVYDEMIIEVNRAFLLKLGFERMKLLGHTMLETRLWEPYERTEFLRALGQERALNEHPLTLKHYNGKDHPLKVSAHVLDFGGASYVLLLAEDQRQPELIAAR